MAYETHHDDIIYPSSIAFVIVHLGCLAAIWTGVSWGALALGAGLYLARMFAITGGYHRYFSHRTYRTSRVFHFLLGFLAESSGQAGGSSVAAEYLHHLQYFDGAGHLHSPR